MITFNNEFNDAKNQIGLYLDFIEKIEVDNYIKLSPNSMEDLYTINSDLIKILKANAFLMLYNVIEATVKNCLWDIFTSIKEDGIKYNRLKAEIQNVILLKKVKADFKTKDSSLATQVQTIIDNVFSNMGSLFPTDKRNLKFENGNLKMEIIQSTFKSHGLNHIAQSDNKQAEAFQVTVSNRNNLAHGDKTFEECGRDYSLIQLREYEEQIFNYLGKCIDETSSYITSRRYEKIVPIM